jgi:uncharacterized protein
MVPLYRLAVRAKHFFRHQGSGGLGVRYPDLRMTGVVHHQDATLAEVVRRLVEAYAPERIYLFGSAARGDSGPDSDYDLMVIVPDDSSEERRRSRLAYQTLHGTGIAADVLVCTRRYFEERLHLRASLPATILREGKLVHAA